METSKKKTCHILQLFFDKGVTASQGAEIVRFVDDPDTVTSHHLVFWFCRFCSSNFNVKDASRSGRPNVGNVGNIMEIIKYKRHAELLDLKARKKLKSDAVSSPNIPFASPSSDEPKSPRDISLDFIV
ncbi:uncharacterized protein [Lepeophtheirus salmonis]|uniref:uncharacterized protein n=1 Tax=Lepeophtheirus salmonis TaxID=72036 RepID=UPI001AE60B2A|nr:uncharacterized protein LOC121129429 [Lepeophtheirus salmonis]